MLFEIKETIEELLALERQHPAMANRLRWLRILKTTPNISVTELVAQIKVPEFEMERWAEFYQFGGIQLLINPQTLLDRSPGNQSMTFSEHAEYQMLKLFNNHPEQLGRQLWVDFDNCRANQPSGTDCKLFEDYKNFETQFKNWRRTDCQTYIQDVIRYAYEKIGRRDLYDGLLQFYRSRKFTNGTVMAEYLVKNGWKAYLYMPDTENPDETERKDYDAHKQIYQAALRTKTWWKVPLSGFIVNYNPTRQLKFDAKQLTPLDPAGKRKLDSLAGIKFGACVFTGARHTGVLFRGKILEVHWKNISEQSEIAEKYRGFQNGELYESSNLIDFGWIEGIIVIPPDSSVSII